MTLAFQARGQENAGLITDNYLPSSQLYINPALIVDQKPWFDLQLVGVSAFIKNNYLFAPESKFIKPNEINTLGLNTSIKHAKAYANAQIYGPAASICIGKNSFGFQTAVRAYGNANRIPPLLRVLDNSLDPEFQNQVYEVSNFRLKALAWAQFGLTYGRIILHENDEMISGGISVNYLKGLGNQALIIKNGTYDNTSGDGDLLNLDGKFSYANPQWSNGNGLSTSIGVTYKRMIGKANNYVPHSPKSGCVASAYKFRLGVSLIDIGRIKFKEYSYGDFDVNTKLSLDSALDFQNTSASLLNSGKQSSNLPAALSVQFDYNLGEGFYANGSLVQKLSLPRSYNVERPNLLLMSIRYERKWLGAGIPLSFVDYHLYQLGLWVRLGPLVIGTDHIVPIFMYSKIYGASVYASLHIPLFKSFACWKKARNNTYDGVPCPKWRY